MNRFMSLFNRSGSLHRGFGLSLAFLALAPAAFAEEAAHEGGGILQTLGIQWQGILIQICGFILCFLILRRFLFGPLQSALNLRRNEIKGAYDRIDEQQREMDQRRADLEQRLASIESEARERIQNALNEANGMKEQILADARDQADRALEQGRQMIRMEQEKAFAQLREEMANLAVSAAGKLIEENMNEDRHRRLVTDFIARMEN
jgi:F-type H+-transporting ATPase subunit b